jgi:hypothetical protein
LEADVIHFNDHVREGGHEALSCGGDGCSPNRWCSFVDRQGAVFCVERATLAASWLHHAAAYFVANVLNCAASIAPFYQW